MVMECVETFFFLLTPLQSHDCSVLDGVGNVERQKTAKNGNKKRRSLRVRKGKSRRRGVFSLSFSLAC